MGRVDRRSGALNLRPLPHKRAAAHKANPGDRIIICTYAVLSQQEAAVYKPTLVYLDEDNRIKDTRNAIPVQVA